MDTDNFQYDSCDSGRMNVQDLNEYDRTRYALAHDTLTLIYQGTFDTTASQQYDVLHDRLKCNQIIDPLISAARKKYGVPHACKATNFVPDDNGDFMLLPNWEDGYYLRSYCLYGLGYLDRYFEEKRVNNEAQENIVKLIMVNRFHVNEDDRGLATKEHHQNYNQMIKYCMVEGALGYNNAIPFWKQPW
ncbi:predicted protein [Chaetoceros tenuissimus]|uniref:Uncharacterized protein n=1 Tax=Chaetoceros tenuissimus TaxID=426638 RepID=A0AAD3H394_9STRA|nr:predicted protein [Chaetoceros tenuissimus]